MAGAMSTFSSAPLPHATQRAASPNTADRAVTGGGQQAGPPNGGGPALDLLTACGGAKVCAKPAARERVTTRFDDHVD